MHYILTSVVQYTCKYLLNAVQTARLPLMSNSGNYQVQVETKVVLE